MEEKKISKDQLIEKLEMGVNLYIVDVRDPEKYEAGSLEYKGVMVENIPYATMITDDHSESIALNQIPKGAEIVTICTSGNKAQKAAALLSEKGYSATSLQGGLTAWRERAELEK